MPQNGHSETASNQDEIILVPVAKEKVRRYFPLSWGLASFALFVAFVVISLMQFDRLSDQRISEVERDAIEVAVKAHEACLEDIEARDAFRHIFDGISELFETTADLPARLLPQSEAALEYRDTLRSEIEARITTVVEDELPPRKVVDCPPLPTSDELDEVDQNESTRATKQDTM